MVTEFFPLGEEQSALQMIKKNYHEEYIPSTYETQVDGINGRITDVEVTSAYVTYENETAILSLIRDISQNKQIEK